MLYSYIHELVNSNSRSVFFSLVYYRLHVLPTAFCSLIDGKNCEMSTEELTGGARIRYIFQSIFVKALEVLYETFVLREFKVPTALHLL